LREIFFVFCCTKAAKPTFRSQRVGTEHFPVGLNTGCGSLSFKRIVFWSFLVQF